MTTSVPYAKAGAREKSPFFGAFIWLSLALLVVSVFGSTENTTIALLGRGLFYGVVLSFIPVLTYCAVVRLEIPKIARSIMIVFMILFAMNFSYLLAGLNFVAVTFMVQYAVILCAFALFMQVGMSGGGQVGPRTVSLFCIGILAIYTAQVVINPSLALGSGWDGGLSNQNLFGMFVFMLFGVSITLLNFGRQTPRALMIAVLIICLILIIASKSRASLIALSLFYATYLIWPFLRRGRITSVLYFAGILGVCAYITYSGADRLNLADFIDQLQTTLGREYGKNTDSGRSVLWNYALDRIAQKPLLGWGTSELASSALNAQLSFHNWYLTVAYHFGIVGLVAYLSLIFLIWLVICRYGHHPYARGGGSALIGMMMTQVFEVSLTQNNLNIGVVYWALLGLTVGRLARDRGLDLRRSRPVAATPLSGLR